MNSEIGQEMFLRSGELTDEHTSGFVRIVEGYTKFDQLNPIEKIIGIPNARERFDVFYVNGIQSILLNLGYIGAFVYLLFYINIFRKVSFTSKMSIIVLLVMSLLEANYLNPYMMLLTIIPCAEIYLKRNNILF